MAINSFLVDQQMSLLSNISFSFCLSRTKTINQGSAVGGVLFTMGTGASGSAMMGVGLARVHGETLLADQLRAAGKPQHTRHVVMTTASQMHDDPNNKHTLWATCLARCPARHIHIFLHTTITSSWHISLLQWYILRPYIHWVCVKHHTPTMTCRGGQCPAPRGTDYEARDWVSAPRRRLQKHFPTLRREILHKYNKKG